MTTAVFAGESARLDYSSASDFTEVSITLKNADNPNPGYVSMSVTLSPEARARTKAITTLAFKRQVAAYIDGHLLSTSTVQEVLDSGHIRFSVPTALVVEWLPMYLK